MKDFAKSIVCNTKAGNSKCGNADVVKDGNTWVVLYAEGTKSKEFDSEAEAKKFASQVGNSNVGNGILDILKLEKPIKMKSSKGAIVTIHPDGSAAHQDKEGSQMAVHHYNSFKEAVEYYKNQGYVKVGNDTPAEYAHRKPKAINDDKTGAEEFFKKLSDDVKDREKKDNADIEKVGNKTTQVAQVGTVKIFYDDKDNVYYTNIGGSIFNNPSFKTKEEAVKYTVQKNKVGNYSTDDFKRIKEKAQRIAETTKDEDKKKRALEIVEKMKYAHNQPNWGKQVEHYEQELQKIGNVKDKHDKELKVGDIVDVRGKKGKITKIIGDVIEVFYDNSGTYNPDRIDRHYADEAKKVGNSASEYEILKQDPSKMHPAYKKAYEEALKKLSKEDEEFKKRFEREYGVKAKNDKSDDKFAYVMREFDEGKLKTPDGKVVTDPAQAKAIAYSESKKTENGLARARNAMK